MRKIFPTHLHGEMIFRCLPSLSGRYRTLIVHVCTCPCVHMLVMFHVYVQEHVCMCVSMHEGVGKRVYKKFCGQVYVCA